MTGREVKSEKEIALEERGEEGARLFSPSAARNREPVRDVFLKHLPQTGTILEIGSGTGEHAVFIAAALPKARWLPGDPDAASRASIAGWIAHESLRNVDPPHAIDVTTADWDLTVAGPVDAIVSINMIHIAPFEAAKGLFSGAGALLKKGGKLILYGPFSRNGAHASPSNADFDASLKSRDPRWGVRDLERDIIPLAQQAGLGLEDVIAMPANNFTAVFSRR